MTFDPQLAKVISDNFREAINTRLGGYQRQEFEYMLQAILGIKNLRNVQLWTREGAVKRNFISRNLGQYEMSLRIFIADRFIQNIEPSYPVKKKPFTLPLETSDYRKILQYFNDQWIRNYCTRIYFSNITFLIEYAADSNVEIEIIDVDSPEFDDVLEGEEESEE